MPTDRNDKGELEVKAMEKSEGQDIEGLEENEAELDEKQKAELKKAMKKEAKMGRKLTGNWLKLVNIISLVMVVFYFWSAGYKPFDAQWNRGVYVMLTYVLIFLYFPFWKRSNKSRPTIGDIVMVLISVFTVGYWIMEFENLNYRAGAYHQVDVYVSYVGLIISIEVCRRVLGWSMTLAGILFLVYGLFGNYFPEPFTHRGVPLDRLATTLFLEQNGVFGIMANVLVTYVILFIFFGAFLQKSGVGKFFIDWPLALAGKTTGGPAKVSVIASAFFGSVSGSAIANTVSTGTFTIPLMKRAGFKPHVAGAIEPSASIGGMFMPPIMGAGGFLMAELTNTPYVNIMLIAIFPAALYFFSVLTMIHFEAKKLNIRGLEDEEFEPARVIFKRHWYKSIPLIVIVAAMLMGYSPGFSAVSATIACVLISWFDKEHRMLPDNPLHTIIGLGIGVAIGWGLGKIPLAIFNEADLLAPVLGLASAVAIMAFLDKKNVWLKSMWEAIIQGGRATLVIGATVGTIGIIVGTIAKTGIGLKFSDIIITLSKDIGAIIHTISGGFISTAGAQLPMAILLIGVASLVLGMGVPVTAAYLITAVLAVPPLKEMLLVPGLYGPEVVGQTVVTGWIACHMIVYWFSQDSNITPPVCVAAYAGAAIAGSDPWKTGWTAFKFAKLLYVVPFLMAYEPAFLLQGTWVEIFHAWSGAIIGTIAFSALTMGYFIRRTSLPQWIILAVATFCCYHTSYTTNFIGIGLFFLIWVWMRWQNKTDPPHGQVAAA